MWDVVDIKPHLSHLKGVYEGTTPIFCTSVAYLKLALADKRERGALNAQPSSLLLRKEYRLW